MVFVPLLPILGYFVLAVLSVIPQTHVLRLALWSIIALLALRAAVSVDMSPGHPNRKSSNNLLIVSMFVIVTRTFDWILEKEPLVRQQYPGKDSQTTIMDALDLATTLRGYGWEWSRRVHIPPETRPTDRRRFIFHVILSAAFHTLLCGFFYTAVRSFSPTGLGAPSGGSIFDETLSFYVRYSRASVITLLASYSLYAVIQACYDACTLVGVLVFQQDPARWPPAFDAPWLATSMREFWGRRWHQFFRRIFLRHGGYPLAFFLGWPGVYLGSFSVSGLYHYIGASMLSNELEPWGVLVGFWTMSQVILAEEAFQRLTGRKVGGAVGWIWTNAWHFVSGNMIFDAFARGGVLGRLAFIDGMVPGKDVIQSLVATIDAWFHAM